MPRFDRAAIIHGSLALFAAALVAKAAHVQLWQRDRWRASAAKQQLADASLPAPRGVITDATGRVLVESRELVALRVAPREVKDLRALRRALTAAGIPKPWVKRATDPSRAWVEIPGRWLPTDVAAATAMRGVHPVPEIERVLSASDGVRRIVGRVDAAGKPLDGVELSLDSLLQGTRGVQMVLRDGRGGRLESPQVRTVAARPGNTVVLTLNYTLQDICDRALADGVAKIGATGGDIVVLDPKTGEVLALASHRQDARTTAATTLSEPFEPGSTVKPLVAARLIDLGRARADEMVNTENGEWTINGRTIHDDEPKKQLALRDVIRYSSNIGIAKFAQRLAPREQFELLRDAGFGTPTGVPYPAEAGGTVRPPQKWTKQSPQSLAMGYEFAVTPLQLAAAYAAVANGGELLEPALVHEIRDADGKVIWRHQRRPVRRMMKPSTAAQVREMLKAVVDSGTSTMGAMASFTLGGKSGTARRVERGIGYAAGHYNAVFAGIFPLDDPQFAVVVKIENPQGDVYFGGKVAAPIMKTVLEGALAARDAALDRAALAPRVLAKARDAYRPKDTLGATTSVAVAPPAPMVPAELQRDTTASDSANLGTVRAIVELPAPPRTTAPTLPPRAVPAVAGLPLRDAVYALSRAGFRVKLADGAPGGRTLPAAGAVLRAGTVVTLYRDP